MNTKKVIKEVARKDREKYINKSKESILNDARKSGEDIRNASSDESDATTTSAAGVINKSNDVYIYNSCVFTVLAIGACRFFHITKNLFRYS